MERNMAAVVEDGRNDVVDNNTIVWVKMRSNQNIKIYFTISTTDPIQMIFTRFEWLFYVHGEVASYFNRGVHLDGMAVASEIC